MGLDNGQSMSLWNPTCPPNLWAAGGLKDEVKIENVMPIEFFLGTNVEALWGKWTCSQNLTSGLCKSNSSWNSSSIALLEFENLLSINLFKLWCYNTLSSITVYLFYIIIYQLKLNILDSNWIRINLYLDFLAWINLYISKFYQFDFKI